MQEAPDHLKELVRSSNAHLKTGAEVQAAESATVHESNDASVYDSVLRSLHASQHSGTMTSISRKMQHQCVPISSR